ncbi:LysR family transcriptional regulator [uncultured Bdellovibrio sp.]|uniref:LysR family transcriptional regulator n=1 Tax=Bdellovibrio sp. HCB-162 TaxID=3394234 RepID=UPI0025EF4873|nr:LysR family transcriptional regulator [uncultured Bdellovibrio sp.]
MDLNLTHLRYFVSAAKLGGLAASAKENHVTQSAVSQGIRKLEEALGCDLLIHQKNRFKLTQEGEALLSKAESLFVQVMELKEHLRSTANEISGDVTLATSATIAQFVLPSVIKKARDSHPLLKPVIQIGDVAFILNEVKKGRAELGIVIDDGNVRDVEKKLIQEGVFCCVQSSSQKYSDKAPFMATRESPGVEELKKIYKKKFSKLPEIAVEVESWEAIIGMVQQGLGVGFVPDLVLSQHQNIKEVAHLAELGQKIKYKTYLIHKGEHQLSRQGKVFYQKLLSTLA